MSILCLIRTFFHLTYLACNWGLLQSLTELHQCLKCLITGLPYSHHLHTKKKNVINVMYSHRNQEKDPPRYTVYKSIDSNFVPK